MNFLREAHFLDKHYIYIK